MLGILYKIMAKAISIQLSSHLGQHVHTSQFGFVGGKSTYDNILSVQLAIEYDQAPKQKLVIL